MGSLVRVLLYWAYMVEFSHVSDIAYLMSDQMKTSQAMRMFYSVPK